MFEYGAFVLSASDFARRHGTILYIVANHFMCFNETYVPLSLFQDASLLQRWSSLATTSHKVQEMLWLKLVPTVHNKPKALPHHALRLELGRDIRDKAAVH